jgi:outer membrane receptor protein involved in Fe transport
VLSFAELTARGRRTKQGEQMNRETQLIMRRIAGVLLPATVLGLFINGSVLAQEESPGIFEEIVVTAQKREQNIMDVPIAISAVTGQQLDDAGIKDVYDLQQNVASLTITRSQTATSTGFSIRGIGSTSNNFGVESSVGLYVDGVYRSRQSSLINELVDVEAVEVLRGPQGTLFGKNTPAGAVQVRTVAPSQDRDAFIDVTAGDYGLIRVSGAANIVINDDWAMRGTIFSSQRDGYIEDVNLGKDLYNDRDRQGVRLQLAYEPSDSFNMRIIADYAEIDEACCGTVTLVDGIYAQSAVPGWPAFDPGALGSDASLGGTPLGGPNPFGGTIFTDFPYPPGLLELIYAGNPAGVLPDNIVTGSGTDDYVTGYNFAPESTNEDSGLSVEFNKTFGNGMTLTSITAFRSFDTYDKIDLDFTNATLGTRINEADQSSFSQEFRLAGEFGDGGNFVVGAYYFGQEIDQITITDGDSPLIEGYLNGSSTFQTIIDAVNGVNALVGPPYPMAATSLPPSLFSQDDILQEQDGWAVFGQVDFPLGENFVVTLGGRYTDEKKDITADYTQTIPWDPDTAPHFAAFALEGCRLINTQFLLGVPGVDEPCDLANPAVGLFDPFRPAEGPFPSTLDTFLDFGVDGWGYYLIQPVSPRPDLDESLSDDQFTGNVKLTWFPSDSTMLYASFSTGFKSGGTNTERIGAQFSPLFDAETSESFEIGFKGDIGPVRMALTYYNTTFEDFQAQSFTGTGFNLQNAGEIENTGFETEFLWRPFENTDIQLIYTHNEADYKSFLAGTCWDGYTFHTGIDDPGLPDGFNSSLDLEVCDKSGNPVAYNPEDRLFLALQQEFNLSTNNTLFFRIEYSSYSEQFTDGDLDPFTIQPDYEILNARIGMNFGQPNISVTLWGRNITDERYYVGSFDAPIQLGRMNAYPAEPATYGATFRMGFD